MTAGKMRERVAFDAPIATDDGYGGETKGWGAAAAATEVWAEFMFLSGGEAVEAARLNGKSLYRVRIRASAATKVITTDYRMRDLRRGTAYQVRSIDAIAEPGWINLRVEGGVAV